jgi:hypothetical protein
MDREEIHTSLNFCHSLFSHYLTQSDPLESEDPTSTSQKLDVSNFVKK